MQSKTGICSELATLLATVMLFVMFGGSMEGMVYKWLCIHRHDHLHMYMDTCSCVHTHRHAHAYDNTFYGSKTSSQLQWDVEEGIKCSN